MQFCIVRAGFPAAEGIGFPPLPTGFGYYLQQLKMADYTTSAFLDAQTMINQGYQQPEVRERQYPVLQKGLTAAPYIMANVEEIKTSQKRNVKGYQFKRIAADNGTTRSHNFTSTQGDSTEVPLSWGTYSESFSLYMNAGKDNMFSNAQMLTNQIRQKQRIMRERIGKGLLESLHAGRTNVSAAGSANVLRNASFDSSLDAFLIDNSDMFFAYLKSVMEQHDYPGQLDVLIDPKLSPIARNIAAQGGQNGTNMAWQLDGMTVMPHVALGTTVGNDAFPSGGVAIALPEYSFGFIPWIPSKYIEGGGDFDSYNGGYSTMNDEIFGSALTYSLRGYTLRADGSSNGGTVDDLLTHWQIAIDVATQISSISTANETPVYEFGLVG